MVGFFMTITIAIPLRGGFLDFPQMAWFRGGGFILFLQRESLGNWCTALRRGCLIPFPGGKRNIRVGRNCIGAWGVCLAGLNAWLCSIRRRIIFLISGWWMRGLSSWSGNW